MSVLKSGRHALRQAQDKEAGSRSLSDLGTKSDFEHSSPFEKGGLRGILHMKAGVLLIKSPLPPLQKGENDLSPTDS